MVREGIAGYNAGKCNGCDDITSPFVLLLQKPRCWWKRHIGHRMCVRFFSETVLRGIFYARITLRHYTAMQISLDVKC